MWRLCLVLCRACDYSVSSSNLIVQKKTMKTFLQHKPDIRKEMNSIVNALSQSEILRQSQILTTYVLNHTAYKAAESVAIYLSFDKEVNTHQLVEDIFKQGKLCFVPRFQRGEPEMEMIRLTSYDDYLNLPVNEWNIKQPRVEEKRESVFDTGKLDLVISPGLAFTEDCARLGRGKGFYDRFLSKCLKEFDKAPFILALAFNEQIIKNIPLSSNDILMDEVIYANKGNT